MTAETTETPPLDAQALAMALARCRTEGHDYGQWFMHNGAAAQTCQRCGAMRVRDDKGGWCFMAPAPLAPTTRRGRHRQTMIELANYKAIAAALGADDEEASATAHRIADARRDLDNAEVFILALRHIMDAR